MRDNDDWMEGLGEPDSAKSYALVSTSWRCSACGAMQLFAMPSQPVECDCGSLWFETDAAETVRIH